jgi:hypothetical protein
MVCDQRIPRVEGGQCSLKRMKYPGQNLGSSASWLPPRDRCTTGQETAIGLKPRLCALVSGLVGSRRNVSEVVRQISIIRHVAKVGGKCEVEFAWLCHGVSYEALADYHFSDRANRRMHGTHLGKPLGWMRVTCNPAHIGGVKSVTWAW